MTRNFKKQVRRDLDSLNETATATGLISCDYAPHIFDAIADDVAQDIWDTADEDHNYNWDDLRLAVGRVLMARLGIEA